MKNLKRVGNRYRAYVKVYGTQRERHFTLDTEPDTMRNWLDETRRALRKRPRPGGHRGSFGQDVQTYLAAVKPTVDRATYHSKVSNLSAYLPRFRRGPRADITRAALLELRAEWLTAGRGKRTGQIGTAPKTIKNREADLRHLFHHFDGRTVPTPIDDLPPLPKTPAAPQFVTVATIRRVAKRLTDPLTKARYMVLTSTGQRPAQLRRAHRTDLNLRRRLWMVRPAKGGHPIPVILTADMVTAWKAFIAADGFGEGGVCRPFDGSDYAKALYAAGWPAHIRPYNAKHTIGITLAEAGAEWEDIKDWFGHTDVKTTRIYTGVVASRLKATAKKLEGRIRF